MNRKVIKAKGKEAFKANYWRSVFAALVLALIGGGFSMTFNSDTNRQDIENAINSMDEQQATTLFAGLFTAIFIFSLIAFLINVFVFNPLKVGCLSFFKENYKTKNGSINEIGSGFQNYKRVWVTLLLQDVFLFLWTLLFIIPGLIKSYSYRMVPYIVRDNPEMSSKEIITRSREMMDGHKWEVFVFDLSFILWILFGIGTFGLGLVFWTAPYMNNAAAGIYLELKD